MILAGVRRRATPVALVALATLIGLAGCAESGPPPVIGVAMGMDVSIARAILPGRQKRFNDSVGPGREVTLKMGDSAEASDALSWATTLTQMAGLVGVVGHESSRSALQAAPMYRERGVVEIVPTGTSSKLARVSPWTFPIVASDSTQGTLIARQLIASGRKHVTLFVQDDEYGRGIVESIQKALLGSDVSVLENVMHTPHSDNGLLVRSMLSHNPRPDVLVLITQGSIALRVAQLAWTRDSTLLLVGTDATMSEAIALRALAPARDRLVLTTYWLADSSNAATQTFFKDFQESGMAGDPQWNYVALYDAVGLLNKAAAEVGGNPVAVRDYLLSLGRNRPSYQGVLGPIDFTGQHGIPARLIRPSATGWEPVK